MGLTLSENATAVWNIDKINFMKRGKSLKCTRPSVNSAKDWFGQLFLISGLVWKRVSPMDVVTKGQSTTIFHGIRPFSLW